MAPYVNNRGMTSRITTRVQSSLGDYYVNVYQEPLRTLTPFKVIERPFSLVLFLHAESASGVRRFVAKKVAHHPSNLSVVREKNQAVVEYEILTKLHAMYRQVPRLWVQMRTQI